MECPKSPVRSFASQMHELQRDRLVEPELRAQLRDLGGIGAVAEHDLHGIAGDQPHQREHRNRHQKQRRYGHQASRLAR